MVIWVDYFLHALYISQNYPRKKPLPRNNVNNYLNFHSQEQINFYLNNLRLSSLCLRFPPPFLSLSISLPPVLSPSSFLKA